MTSTTAPTTYPGLDLRDGPTGVRSVDASGDPRPIQVEEIASDGTALTGALNGKETGADPAGLGDELGQVLEPGQDPDVRWLVDW